MGKVTSAKTISRPHTEDEMRKALTLVEQHTPKPKGDDDNPCDILRDTIDELLYARGILADLRAFIATLSNKLARR